MRDYLLGVLTTPALAVACLVLFVAWVRATMALRQRGITFAAHRRRDVDGISDYTLQRDIWWERSFGPIFVGGWYHQYPVYEEPDHARLNRWVGIGSADGPCVTAIYSRDLGEV